MSAKSVHNLAIKAKASRPDMLVVGLASIIDGIVIVMTLGGYVPMLRQKASLRAAKNLASRRYWD